MPTSTTTASPTLDVLARLEAIRPIIEEHATAGELHRDLAPEVFAAFRSSGLLRLAIPRSHGGLELNPVDTAEVFEAIGRIDGSAAWVLNQQYAVALLATWARAGIDELFADPDANFSGVFWPPGAAHKVDGGYRITSKVGFASGCSQAKWFLAPAVVMNGDEPVIDGETGQPDFLATVLPMSELEILDTWNTLGMRATGSNDVIISGVFVPDSRAARIFKLAPRPAALANPLYALAPWPAITAHAAVPLGIAQAALDRAVELARTKVPNFMQVALQDKGVVQADLARARAVLEAARCYLRDAMAAAVVAVEADQFGTDHKISLQLSANNSAAAAEEAMRIVHRTVGTATVRDEAGMGRRYRDLNTITQHTSIQPARWESVGKVMFGLESDWFPFAL